jgi:hypothetical protein
MQAEGMIAIAKLELDSTLNGRGWEVVRIDSMSDDGLFFNVSYLCLYRVPEGMPWPEAWPSCTLVPWMRLNSVWQDQLPLEAIMWSCNPIHGELKIPRANRQTALNVVQAIENMVFQ